MVGGVGLLAILTIREPGAGGAAQARQRVELEERAVAEAVNERRGSELDGAPLVAQPSSRDGVARFVTLAGRVLDEHGDAVEGVSVGLRARQDQPGPAHALERTDSEGRFRFTGLAAGVWWLEADSHELAAGARRSVDASAGDVEAEFRVLRGHVLVLRVRWADGSPVDSIRAMIPELDVGRDSPRQAFPGSRAGEFELRGVKAGVHLVHVAASGNGQEIGISRSVTVPSREPLEFELPRHDLVLRGTVLDAEGRPVKGASVGVTRGPTVQVAPDGSFELRWLAPGRTWLSASAPGHHCEPIEVNVRAAHPDVELQLVRLARIQGRVADPSGRPVAEARLTDGYEQQTFEDSTDREGYFDIPVSPGHRILRATASGFADSEELQLKLEPGEVRAGLAFRLRTACRVVGRILDAEGEPVENATVYALYSSLLTGTDGSFDFDACPPEPIWIMAFAGGERLTAEVTPQEGVTTSLELRLERRDPVLLDVRVTRGTEPIRAKLFLRSGTFMQEQELEREGSNSVVLARPGRWRGLVSLEGARRLSDDLDRHRLVDFTAPDLESWSLELDWNSLTPPLGIEEVWSLLYD